LQESELHLKVSKSTVIFRVYLATVWFLYEEFKWLFYISSI